MVDLHVLESDLSRVRKVLKETDFSLGYFSMSDDDLAHLAFLTLFEHLQGDYLNPAQQILTKKEIGKVVKRSKTS